MSWSSLIIAVSAASAVLAAPSNSNSFDRGNYRSGLDYDYGNYREDPYIFGSRGKDSSSSQPAPSHTYQSLGQCDDLCAIPCTKTSVFLATLSKDPITMYHCAKLKPPQQAAPFLSTLKGNSFYMALFVIGIIVVGVILLVTLCFCCSYCCGRNQHVDGNSSRGSSKQALAHHEDGEFKEYLTGNGLSNGQPDDIGVLKREREFARRPRGVPQVV